MWKNRTFATACYADDGHALKDKSRCAAMRAVVLFLSLAFLFPSLSWGACVEATYGFTARDKGCGDAACIAEGLNDYWFGQACGSGNFCTLVGYGVDPNGRCYNWNSRQDCLATLIRCSSQSEADSLSCVNGGLQWQGGQCKEPPRDTLTICQNTWGGDVSLDGGGGGYIGSYMELWKCPDNYTSYEDCVPQMRVPGTCSQNGYEAGVQPKDSIPRTADCFAAFEGDCYMMDRATQQQFLCSCATDNNSGGDCSQAYRDLQSGACRNPYASSSASSSPSSSGSSSPSSSGGTSSPSSSGSGGDRPGESHDVPRVDSAGTWNYNYSGILNAINNNVVSVDNSVNRAASSIGQAVSQVGEAVREQSQDLGFIRANTQQVASNTQYTNNLINTTIVPSINGVAGKIDLFKDEWSGLWTDFTASASSDGDYPADTTDYSGDIDYDKAITDTSVLNLRDTIMAQKRSLDSVFAYVDSVRNDTTTNYVAFDDIYDWSDTSSIKSKLSEFFIPNVSTLQSCPNFHFDMEWPVVGQQNIRLDFGNLASGIDVCALIRGFVKLFTLVFILFSTVRSFIRAFSSGGT